MENQDTSLQQNIGFERASLVPLIALGVEILFQICVMAIPASDAVRTWIVIVGNQLVFFFTAFIFLRKQKISFSAVTGIKKAPKPQLVPLYALIAVLCVAAFAPLAGLLSSGLKALGYNYTPQYYVPLNDVGLFVLALLALSVLPAIGEEVMLRGVLLSGTKGKSPVFGIFFTAAIFALFHGNLAQVVHQFMLGAIMAYLVLLTGSIYASAIVHFFNNLIALLIEYLFVNGKLSSGVYSYFTGNAEGLSVGVLVGMLFLSWTLLFFVGTAITFLVWRERHSDGSLVPEEKSLKALLSPCAEEVAPESDEYHRTARFIPAFLVGFLVLLLITNVLSEVVK